MKVAAAYIRVSTDDQLEYSPDSQLEKIRLYAERNQILLPKEFIFVDEGISGRKTKNRPAFNEMIGLAKRKPKPFDVILVWKFSRFARNREDSIVYKSMLRKEHNIECEWLFIKGLRDGNVRCATTDNADDWCTLIGHILGRPFYSHSMRHYWTTMCTKANLPTEIIRELQGWNSTEMCSLYSDIDTADLLGDFFDENGIKQNNAQTNMFDSFNTQSNKGRKGR